MDNLSKFELGFTLIMGTVLSFLLCRHALIPGLAWKNPPRKTHPKKPEKTHHEKTQEKWAELGFFRFLQFLNFFLHFTAKISNVTWNLLFVHLFLYLITINRYDTTWLISKHCVSKNLNLKNINKIFIKTFQTTFQNDFNLIFKSKVKVSNQIQ